ncbi:hypothetical protein [Chthonobacter rhizosphaerae]|uniref:hypothetical protein n=1 Tax=Chthonobacter rhizosphaerae TaxID=2735553 RepID=UPI0015EEDE57|nr:hypothetical protein [Chthonobacter rhizosphaerae]
MPPLVVVALAGAGLYVVGRVVKQEMRRVAKVIEDAQRTPDPVVIPLEKDPRTGVYQLRRHDEG